jgi:hypothetical protein
LNYTSFGGPVEIVARALWLPKAGNTAEEYEDAWAVEDESDEASDRFRCAVADGATEASFSGLWARLLTRGYCDGVFPDAPTLCDFAPLQGAWEREVAAIPLPWYAEEKARSGAFSSLLGLTIAAANGPDGGRWEALAVGDSCLFQVRDDRLLTAWPLAAAADFTNRPTLLSSHPARNDAVTDQLAPVAGDWLPGDAFYLLTDALACWFLLAREASGQPWRDLDAVATADGSDPFIAWIADLRADRALRNDDVTLLRVAVDRGL